MAISHNTSESSTELAKICPLNTIGVVGAGVTSEETLQVAKRLLSFMGKEAIVVGDSPGFVSNRVLMLTVNEAIFLLHERVAAGGGH
jgi:3-hydroxybutyryl-CoA dehydrogenase